MFKQLLNMLTGGGSSQENLKQIINEGAFLVDVRSAGEYASGSAKGAVNIPLDQITKDIKKFQNKKNVVVFCRSGMRSSQAKSILEKNGITNVHNGGTWGNVSAMVK
jgi:rhodanese-related sulfurtransferase